MQVMRKKMEGGNIQIHSCKKNVKVTVFKFKDGTATVFRFKTGTVATLKSKDGQ